MAKLLTTLIAAALLCSGCLDNHGNTDCPIWEFNGETICVEPVTDDEEMSFRGLEPGDMEGMLVQISPADAATNFLAETTPIVPREDSNTRWRATVERTGPGISRQCFKDGVHVEDPATGLTWEIVPPGECVNLRTQSGGLLNAEWE